MNPFKDNLVKEDLNAMGIKLINKNKSTLKV